ncbi:zinc finger protein 845-like isoform X1 [Ostrinia furnacalis]|uniref:zinc finger protein 845-like isoform X1 n=1 Tax=Ostrinia furnacalis TaxID=93504 RepID=UPI00103C5515|nr:zinc finger protein 845-like isoform X1 [Ostrinia furnacalis]
MQEIDINIEGYNVNGICVGCLNHNRKMSYIDEVKDCFKLLAQIDVPDYLSIQVCWECLAAVRSVMRFRQQIQRAYTILIKYSAKNPFLDSPWDLTQYATTNLTRTQVEVGSDVLDVQDVKEIEIEVKSEPEDNETLLPKQEELKIENEFPDIDDRFSDDFPPDQNATSEDDMQLSKLKEKKVKKEKKAKKRRKKNSDESSDKPKTEQKSYKLLKNLPEDLVTIYTMTEEEMWVMRNQDLKDKEFLRYKHRCEDCLLTFNSEKLMKEHTLAKHRLKSEDCHKCDICKSYFLGKDHLLTHRAQHLTAYWCSACGHATSVRRRARQHAATHQTVTKEKEYECRNCGKTFPSRSKLSYHRTKNHKEKLQCDCCGKVFISKMMLRHHLK